MSTSAASDAATTAPATPATTLVCRGDHIALDALLKATGIAGSGGHAKLMILGGAVRIDGAAELRRSCKVRPGQTVEADGQRVQVVSSDESTGLAS